MGDRNGKHGKLLLLAAAAGCVMALAACSLAIPSGDLPKVEHRWVVTALDSRIGMDELINPGQQPSSVTSVVVAGSSMESGGGVRRKSSNGEATDSCQASNVSADIASRNDEVVVNVGRTTLECSLRDLCPTCSAGRQGKPALRIEREDTFRLPDRDDLQVESVSVTGGTVVISLAHDLDFVPLRQGEFDVEVWSVGDKKNPATKLATFSLDRDLVGSPPVTYEHDFSRSPTTVAGGLRLVVDIDAAADPSTTVDIDLSETIRVTTEVKDVTVSAATVRIDKEFETDGQPINVDDDTVSEIIDRITGDTTIIITFTNPFPIQVEGTLDLGEAVQLTDEEMRLSVRPGTSDRPVDTRKELTLTRAELQTFLEQGEFSFMGRVSTDDAVTLDTDQTIRIRIAIDVSLVTEPEGA